ncbi:hypothetical protein FMEAI12_2240016 [Parafrankia sp. Ea1.12]|nr:hypothetical protein FMEAI12_2240016 [Parafrankia sp. Ea1.12]
MERRCHQHPPAPPGAVRRLPRPRLFARERVASFSDVLVHRRGGAALEAWVQWAEACALPALRGYATGLRSGWDAVAAGVTHTWSSGQAGGQGVMLDQNDQTSNVWTSEPRPAPHL